MIHIIVFNYECNFKAILNTVEMHNMFRLLSGRSCIICIVGAMILPSSQVQPSCFNVLTKKYELGLVMCIRIWQSAYEAHDLTKLFVMDDLMQSTWIITLNGSKVPIEVDIEVIDKGLYGTSEESKITNEVDFRMKSIEHLLFKWFNNHNEMST